MATNRTVKGAAQEVGRVEEAGLAWATAGRARYPEDPSGDVHLVATHGGEVLVAAIDGGGHGPLAAAAAARAREALRAWSGEGLDALLARVHAALHGTNGASLAVAALAPAARTLTWASVGNVVGALRRAGAGGAAERLVLRAGALGHHLPAVEPVTLAYAPGDVLAFATDGLEKAVADDLHDDEAPGAAAMRLLAAWRKGSDDALVWVGRFE